MVTLNHYLILSAALFILGAAGVLVRRNLLIVFMSVELMLNAANLAFLAFARYYKIQDPQVVVLFVIVVAAVEAAVGLAILVAFFRNRGTVKVDEASLMKG